MADLVLEDTAQKMHDAVSHSRREFSKLRTGRANPELVEKLMIDYYGTDVPLQQVAGVTVPEARQLLITPYDKSSVGAIEKAIQKSDLGLTPSNDGVSIRLNFPPVTGDHRKQLVRQVRQLAEDGKVSLRNDRRAGRHELEALHKDNDITEDELQRYEKDLDKMIHQHEADIDAALLAKEQELLED
ncbi:MAG: ribosome recycling factor [Actinobacteria bacterium]|nr:ribosome recycling factor [Actinomycetota bacterium]